MAKKDKKATKTVVAVVGQTKEAIVAPPVLPVPPVVSAQPEVTVKKGYYDPVRSKAYRDKIRAAAIAGGHVFKERGVGTGTTVKKTSKTGKEYYYQPWSQLTEEQKKARLEAARKRSAEDRVMAQKYKDEHPEMFQRKVEGVA